MEWVVFYKDRVIFQMKKYPFVYMKQLLKEFNIKFSIIISERGREE